MIEERRASEIAMHWDVIEATPESDCVIRVRFADGLTGRVCFSPDYFTGFFEPLRDPQRFAQVFVDDGAVAWPGALDLAPDAMYREIREHGEWVLTGSLQDAPPSNV